MYGSKPRDYTSPHEKGDHPEVDLSEELDEEGIKRYQTMIGCLQWAISLGRFDIMTAVMTMSRFRAAPGSTRILRSFPRRQYELEPIVLASMDYPIRITIGVIPSMEQYRN